MCDVDKSELYTIVLTESPGLKYDKISLLAREIAPIIRRPLYDVSRILRYGQGVFAFNLQLKEATQVAEILCQNQLAACTIANPKLVSLPAPRTFSRAEIKEIYFEINSSGKRKIAWDEIWFLGCGVVWERPYEIQFLEANEFKMMLQLKDDKQSKRQLKNRLLQQVNKAETDKVEGDYQVYLDIVLKNSWERLRISRRYFCYKLLTSNLHSSSKQNFHQLVHRIVQYAGKANLTVTTKSFLQKNGDISQDIVFESEEQFSKYLRWNCINKEVVN